MKQRVLAIVGVVAVFAAVRGPLHRAAFALPVSNDDAIPLLMARAVLRGELSTILWNQPYNGTLDAYLLAPGLLLGSSHLVFRIYELLCALLLVTAVGLLAARVSASARAGVLAALLAAAGTPYMALMAATGPTPNFLVPLLVGLWMLAAVRWPLTCAVVAGLGVWNSALTLPSLCGVVLGKWLAREPLPNPWRSGFGFCVGLIPLLTARVIGAAGESNVMAVRPRWLWMAGVADLAHAAAGLVGIQVPLVIDGPERADLPYGLGVVLLLSLLASVGAGLSRRALPLVGWALALAAAFAYSRRTGGDDVRYLYGCVLPLLALAGCGLAQVWERWHWLTVALAAGILVPWVVGDHALLLRWRDPEHARQVWQVPSVDPALQTLRRAGVGSAYASLQFAGRLALGGEGALVVSQAWNERIPGDPLRFRDEVDLDPHAAWVLSPHLSRGMPRAGGLRDLLRELGGTWKEDLAGDLVIFRGFHPPYDESRPILPLAVATLDGVLATPAVTDRDISTTWTSPAAITPGFGLRVLLEAPQRLAALVLSVDLEHTPLVAPWACAIDGSVVRRGPAPYALQWVGGVPRAGKQALLSVGLGDRVGREVTLIFQGTGPPLRVAEVFLYGPDALQLPAAGEAKASEALQFARSGAWDDAVRLYADAVRAEPQRASYHAALARARWRSDGRRWLDVESLDDGGPALIERR